MDVSSSLLVDKSAFRLVDKWTSLGVNKWSLRLVNKSARLRAGKPAVRVAPKSEVPPGGEDVESDGKPGSDRGMGAPATVSDQTGVFGSDGGQHHRRGNGGPLDDVEHQAEAVVAHAGLDKPGLRPKLPDLEALDPLLDGLRRLLDFGLAVHGIGRVRCR